MDALRGLTHVYVETVSACDLECRFCPRVVHKDGRGARLLDDGILGRLIPDLGRLPNVSLNGLGEPLLDRRLPGLIRRLSEQGVRTRLTTNGTLLDSAGLEVLRAGISMIALSLDGATDHTQAALRDGARTEELLRRFAALVRARRELGAATHLAITTVLSRENVAELPALVERAARAGADSMMVKNLTFLTVPGSEAASFAYGGQADDAVLDRAMAQAEALGLALSINENGGQGASGTSPSCPYGPASTVFVSVEGLVFPCFAEGERWMAEGGRVPTPRAIGDLEHESLGAIWAGPAARAFRDAFAGNANPACAACAMLGERYRQSPLRRSADAAAPRLAAG